jgi:hypothetical protein
MDMLILSLGFQSFTKECYSECRNIYGIDTPKRSFKHYVEDSALDDLRKFRTPARLRLLTV